MFHACVHSGSSLQQTAKQLEQPKLIVFTGIRLLSSYYYTADINNLCKPYIYYIQSSRLEGVKGISALIFFENQFLNCS